jgi:hypothetical protein
MTPVTPLPPAAAIGIEDLDPGQVACYRTGMISHGW